MRKYELVCVIHPDLDETAFNGVIEKVKGWIIEAGGTADKVEIWGRRRLAYIIKKQREGQYILFNLTRSAIGDTVFLFSVRRHMASR